MTIGRSPALQNRSNQLHIPVRPVFIVAHPDKIGLIGSTRQFDRFVMVESRLKTRIEFMSV
jgi:hypothetical protein